MQELAHEPRRSRRFPASSLGRLVWRLTSDHPQGLAKTAPARSDSEKRSHCRGRVRKESVFTIWHSASVRPALHLLHQLCLPVAVSVQLSVSLDGADKTRGDNESARARNRRVGRSSRSLTPESAPPAPAIFVPASTRFLSESRSALGWVRVRGSDVSAREYKLITAKSPGPHSPPSSPHGNCGRNGRGEEVDTCGGEEARHLLCPVPARPGRECHSAGNHCLLPPGSCDLRPAPFCTRYRLLSGCARRARNLPAKRLQRWLSCPARGGRPAYPTARRRKIGLGARGCQPLRRDLRRLPARG